MYSMQQLSRIAPLVLRVGLSGVMLWFGTNQLLHADLWTSWVPQWALISGLSADQIVLFNGLFEVAAGAALLIGLYTRFVALLLFLHLVVIVYDIGLTAIGVRDIGIATGLLTLALDDRSLYSVTKS